jgi:hypothetical protein
MCVDSAKFRMALLHSQGLIQRCFGQKTIKLSASRISGIGVAACWALLVAGFLHGAGRNFSGIVLRPMLKLPYR